LKGEGTESIPGGAGKVHHWWEKKDAKSSDPDFWHPKRESRGQNRKVRVRLRHLREMGRSEIQMDGWYTPTMKRRVARRRRKKKHSFYMEGRQARRIYGAKEGGDLSEQSAPLGFQPQ